MAMPEATITGIPETKKLASASLELLTAKKRYTNVTV
jgi:hypothetical protein